MAHSCSLFLRICQLWTTRPESESCGEKQQGSFLDQEDNPKRYVCLISAQIRANISIGQSQEIDKELRFDRIIFLANTSAPHGAQASAFALYHTFAMRWQFGFLIPLTRISLRSFATLHCCRAWENCLLQSPQ
jgi:hypothetical protein